MKLLLVLVRIYTAIIVVWALTSWIGGLPNPLGTALHWLCAPVWWCFGWAQLGNINFAGVIALVLLFLAEERLKRKLQPTAPENPNAV